MRIIKAVPITSENFAPYGNYYNLHDKEPKMTEDCIIKMTDNQIIDYPMNLGITFCKAGDFDSVSMERHFKSEEVQFCGDAEMVLTVAASDPEQYPRSEDVQAFILKPGDVVVFNKGIWHDANHGVSKDTMYYFLCKSAEDDQRELEWVEVRPEPVHVIVK